ncbi:PTS system mannose/fructose/sorbose family transporter subunit IID, partial [Erysipelatoclostridium ramosum]
VAALEENRANGAEIDDGMINGVKVGLMGPLSGIGDSFFQGLMCPIFLSIGISLAADGSIVGPLFYIFTMFPLIVAF